MGPQSILRALAVLALAAIAGGARAQTAPAVTVVELSGSDAAKLRAELVRAGFAVMSSAELDAATAGVDGGKDLGEALAALTRAREAFGGLDCAAASVAAESAITLLAARAAAGIDAGAALRAAWSYALLCRDRAGDFDGAMRAATALRRLGSDAELLAVGIDAAVLAKYPEVDVTAAGELVSVELTADAGAALTVDLKPVGTSPATAVVAAGRHLVAAAAGSRRAAMWVDVTAATKVLSLRLFEQDAPLSRISERVASWKASGPDPSGVATFLEHLLLAAQGQPWNPSSDRPPLLVVLGANATAAQLQVWANDGPGAAPTMQTVDGKDGAAAPSTVAALTELLRKRHAMWGQAPADLGAPDPDLLLREAPVARDRQGRRSAKTQWWVYAAIAGAVSLGGAVVLAYELSDDTQHVELRWP